MTPGPELRLRVEAVDEIADRVVRVTAADPRGVPLPPWSPGAHIDVVTPAAVRQYSLCGDVDDRSRWTIAVLRETGGRGGSAWVHDVLRPGDPLTVRGPRNHFELRPAERYLFVAGGIGITPILPMLRRAAAMDVPWKLAYGARSRSAMAFADELRALGDASASGNGTVDLWPQDERGHIDLATVLGQPEDGTAIYCCGPAPLLDAVATATTRWPEGSLRIERFEPVDRPTPARSDTFEVQLASTGEVLPVPPDRTVLAVLEDHGVPVVSSCQEGTCGTCETGVLDGEIDHRDSLLTAEERAANDVMYVCCSRAISDRLVLDL